MLDVREGRVQQVQEIRDGLWELAKPKGLVVNGHYAIENCLIERRDKGIGDVVLRLLCSLRGI